MPLVPFKTIKELQKMVKKNHVGFSWMQNWFHPPMWYFVDASAEEHDENYKKGGTSKNKTIADVGFQEWNMRDALLLEDLDERKEAYWWCCWYYILIRTFGGLAFNYKDKTMKHTFFGIVIGASIVIAGVASYSAYSAIKRANTLFNGYLEITSFLNYNLAEGKLIDPRQTSNKK